MVTNNYDIVFDNYNFVTDNQVRHIIEKTGPIEIISKLVLKKNLTL